MTDIYFPVEKIPVDQIISGFEHPSGINHVIVITKPGGVKRIVQYCSEIYHLVPNAEVVPAFETELSKFFKVEKRIRMRNWARFYIDFILKDKMLEVVEKDAVFPKITLINSYDGAVKYQFTSGFYRLICTNGLTIPVGEQRKFKSMHTPKLGKETSFGAVLEMASEFLASASDIFESYRELHEQQVRNWELRIEEVVEETSFPPSLQEDVMARMQIEMSLFKELPPSDWMIYNAFNYQLNHNEDLKAKESKKEDVDSEVLEYLLKY